MHSLQGSGFRVQRFWAKGLKVGRVEFRVQGLGFGCEVEGLEFRVIVESSRHAKTPQTCPFIIQATHRLLSSSFLWLIFRIL